MRVLGVDTSSNVGSVALVECGADPFAAEVIASATARVSNAHGESLLPLIELVLRAARASRESLELLAVGSGPGSFTGTRIAVATMKGIALASGRPLRGVDSFASLALDSGAPDGAPVAIVIDARKGEVYVGAARIVGCDVVSLVEPAHLPPERALAHLAPALGADRHPAEVLFAVGDGVRLVAELSTHCRRAIEVRVPRASAIAALAAARHALRQVDEVDALEPLYVRPPDVTLPKGTPGMPRNKVDRPGGG